jgi:D-inositol-3-phosphate glycosyltransferase
MPDRLRVCLLGEGFYPEVVGGMEIHTYHLAERLLDLGVECEVLARPVRPETPREQRVGRVTVRHLGFGGQLKGRGAAAALPLAGFVARYGAWLVGERRRFDLVLALGAKTTAVPGLLAHLAAGLPLVVLSLTSGEFAEPISAASLAKGGALRRLTAPWQRFRRLMLGRAAAAIAVSEEVAAGFLALGVPPERVVRIPMGVDTDRFRPAAPGERAALRARLGLPADRTVFAFVGRLSRAKGLPMLARLWPGVVARHPDAHLLLVGSGEGSFDDCEAEVRAIAAEAGVADRLTITGRTDDVPPWLRAADAFLFPSDREGFGLVLLEAMAAGLSIVSTAVGAAPGLVADPAHGRVVPPGDGGAFAAAIDDLCARRADWPAMGAAARTAVVEGYGLDAVAARYAGLLRRVAAGGPVGGGTSGKQRARTRT